MDVDLIYGLNSKPVWLISVTEGGGGQRIAVINTVGEKIKLTRRRKRKLQGIVTPMKSTPAPGIEGTYGLLIFHCFEFGLYISIYLYLNISQSNIVFYLPYFHISNSTLFLREYSCTLLYL